MFRYIRLCKFIIIREFTSSPIQNTESELFFQDDNGHTPVQHTDQCMLSHFIQYG